MAKTLPGPEKAGGRPRSKPAGSKGSRGRKAAAAADEEGDSAMPDAGERGLAVWAGSGAVRHGNSATQAWPAFWSIGKNTLHLSS